MSTVRIAGVVASDNEVSVRMNQGTPVPITRVGAEPFSALTEFLLTSGFNEDNNTLSFIVTNSAGGSNPTGLQVRIDSSIGVSTQPMPGSGTPITIRNTGRSSQDALLNSGIDGNWKVKPLGGAEGSAHVLTGAAMPSSVWLAAGGTSNWIGPTADQSPSAGSAATDYIYSTTFEVPNTTNAKLTLRLASDNQCKSITLNGTAFTAIPVCSLSAFSQPVSIDIRSKRCGANGLVWLGRFQ